MLINLGTEPPPFFARFERMFEIIGRDDEKPLRARTLEVLQRTRLSADAYGDAIELARWSRRPLATGNTLSDATTLRQPGRLSTDAFARIMFA